MSKKKQAYFIFPNEENIRLVPGDELKLIYEDGDGVQQWKSRGHIVRIVNEEICLELKNSKGAPTKSETGEPLKFTIEFIWKSTSFDRMKMALRIFQRDEQSVSNYM
jgi:regulator of nonsense transcripts 1